MASPQEMTQLLVAWSDGDQEALEQLIPIVYDELHRLAGRYMRRERADHTLQASALVNEVWLRLFDQNVSWQDRSHFFGIAARLMRQVLIDYARSRHYAKRGGDQQRISLSQAGDLAEVRSAELIALDEALVNLAEIDPKKSQIVELRFFGGLTIEETAEYLNLSHATIEREWKLARAWLKRRMTGK